MADEERFMSKSGASPPQKTLKELREGLGMTQLDVAFELKVTPQTIYFWERGTREPRARHLQQLARLYGVSASDIYIPDPEEGKAAA